MWDLKDEHLDSQNIMNTDTFPITDRFFAFEMVGRDEAGNPVNGDYRVSLMYPILVDKVRCISPVDGKIYKADWITMEPGDYLFQIQNYTNVKLRITVTYYSWN